MTRLPLLGAAALSIALSISSGCIFAGGNGGDASSDADPDATASDTSNDTSRYDTGGDADTDGTTDEDTYGAGCNTDSDCPDRDHASYTCESGSCQLATCTGDWEDLNDDPTDGCECASDETKTYWRDRDGDGYGEPDTERRSCDGPPDSWGGAVVGGDSSNADCRPMDKAIHPGANEEESWRCDGLDNDCDEKIDEICCSEFPDRDSEIVTVSPNERDQSTYAFAPAHADSPDAAAYIVSWVEENNVIFQHVDRTGATVGSSLAGELPHDGLPTDAEFGDELDADGFALTHRADGYTFAITYGGSHSGLVVGTLKPGSSSPVAFKVVEGPDENQEYAHPALASVARSGVHVLAWSQKLINNDVEVFAYRFKSLSELGRTGALELKNSEIQPARPAPPTVATNGARFLLAWHSVPDTISGQFIEPNGDPENPFQFQFPSNERAFPYAIDAVSPGKGKWVLVHPVYRKNSGGESSLVATPIDSENVGSLSPGPTLVDNDDNGAPGAHIADVDGDGTPDRLVVAWQQGYDQDDPLLQVGWAPLGSLGKFDDHVAILKEDGSGSVGPVPAVSDSSAAVVWHEHRSGEPRDVEFSPLSIDGPPVCP